MEPIFYALYEDLYSNYQINPTRPPEASRDWQDDSRFLVEESVGWVVEAIDYAVERGYHRHAIRPDAKYFLLTNLHQMVALPLIAAHPTYVRTGELREALRLDTQLIISTADRRSANPEEISGGDIIRSIAELWTELQVNRPRFWG